MHSRVELKKKRYRVNIFTKRTKISTGCLFKNEDSVLRRESKYQAGGISSSVISSLQTSGWIATSVTVQGALNLALTS
jgi:hypothetical protein